MLVNADKNNKTENHRYSLQDQVKDACSDLRHTTFAQIFYVPPLIFGPIVAFIGGLIDAVDPKKSMSLDGVVVAVICGAIGATTMILMHMSYSYLVGARAMVNSITVLAENKAINKKIREDCTQASRSRVTELVESKILDSDGFSMKTLIMVPSPTDRINTTLVSRLSGFILALIETPLGVAMLSPVYKLPFTAIDALRFSVVGYGLLLAVELCYKLYLAAKVTLSPENKGELFNSEPGVLSEVSIFSSRKENHESPEMNVPKHK